MRKFLAAILWLGLCASAMAQSSILPQIFFDQPASVVSAYTGPADKLTGSYSYSCWGMQACSSAKRGTAIAKLCYTNAGTNVACVDVNADATTGQAVPTTVNSVLCPGDSHCTVRGYYDQGNVGTPTAALTVAAQGSATSSDTLGGKYAMRCNYTNTNYTTASDTGSGTTVAVPFIFTQPFSYIAEAERTASFTLQSLLVNSINNALIGWLGSANTSVLYAGGSGAFPTLSDSVPHAISVAFTDGVSASSSKYQFDVAGLVTGQSLGTAASPGAFQVCQGIDGLVGVVMVVYGTNGDQSANFTNINTALGAYW